MPTEYKSGFEASLAAQLTRAKIQFEYEPGPLPYLLVISTGRCGDCNSKNVVSKRKYIPDWVFGGKIVVESKGKFTSEMRTKMLSVIASNPELDIRMLFMRDNWLTRAKKHKYTEWCKQKGIKCAVGEFPKEWLREFRKLQNRASGQTKNISSSGIDGRKQRKGIA